MKHFYLLLTAMSSTLIAGVASNVQELDRTVVVNEKADHSDHTDGSPSALSPRLGIYKAPARAVQLETANIKYQEPENLFTMGYTPNNSYYAKVVRRGGAYTPQTWRNVSSGYEAGSVFEWEYDSPQGEGEGASRITSSAENLTVSYPYQDGWWNAPALTASAGSDKMTYYPTFVYRLGGPSPLVFSDGVLDFGMTTYSQMLYTDPKGRRTTTFGSLKYSPTASDPYSVTKWTSVMPDAKKLKMKGFFNIFHTPDTPYAITKIWGWIEYTALKETELTMTLYKLGEDGSPTDQIIASGKHMVSVGSDKSLKFDLRRPGEPEDAPVTPITIDCAFAAVLEGFDAPDAFYKLQPILGAGTVWKGGDECPWPHNCGVLLSWDENGGEKDGYFIDSKVYAETTGSDVKLGACDFLWMVDGDFSWLFEKSGVSSIDFTAAGGEKDLVFNSYYPLNNEFVKITKDAEWLDYSLSPASDVASDNGLKVTAIPSDAERTGHLFITGPAMNYTLTVTQGTSSGVEEMVSDNSIVLTEYYDLTGRMLNGLPADGIYIRIDIYSNGERKATKVCI